MDEAAPSVWPLALALLVANLVAAAVLAAFNDSAVPLIGSVLYIGILGALPIVIIGTIAGALGYWYGLAPALVAVGAPLTAWLTWGLMIVSEGDDALGTAVVLLAAQMAAAGVVLIRSQQAERA